MREPGLSQGLASLLLSCLIALVAVAQAQVAAPSSGAARPSGPEMATLSFEDPLCVGGPICVHVELPKGAQAFVQYPVGVEPDNLGCHEFEVRRNGELLPRLALPRSSGLAMGLSCGNIGISGHPMKHPGRLPLHLQYRFETPGIYEVRYCGRVGAWLWSRLRTFHDDTNGFFLAHFPKYFNIKG